MDESTIAELRAELRRIARARERGAAAEKARVARQTEIMGELVDAGISQAEVARDAKVTRAAVGIRLTNRTPA